MSNEDKTTHFGYQQVPWQEKQQKVAGVFRSVARRYDMMNDLISLGSHRILKRFTIEMAAVRPGHKVLDLAGGTGDLAIKFSRLVGDKGLVVLADINDEMLAVGRDRVFDAGCSHNTEVTQVNGECLPFADNTFNCVTIAFGLRNITDKDKALRSMLRVLKPGGRLLVLEFSTPASQNLAKMYELYSFWAWPKLGKAIVGDAESYQYLAESIRMHPDQETLKNMVTDAGFIRSEYFNMIGGIVALHRGFKA
ncbi:MAG: bifunctional demethylmenaquinone methyltransferase/2-methoxy-6-polyprenyl-1,4-benzoquinol methylase UbiE [Gammaproteobacteria bacterium]|jgi:demethylmenaquinone methyltransferase/2-methoxy-6-polyprenyl-1,4-benzoquinol methylase|nr:bifunctional demethylmenaquinone methyltransferase/2-methoxy-6-polyprenyl-1,4-benzoquinol methylase UbiE [Gammaproteobacteria bacterium]MBQ0773398.1 bifunctional demethylmenaquinone methyltransferase/2-methoxy-6-polyprenyl-1,4-benzoquinol methylase UbiE [Gammaproteobacteria bacterium]